MGHHVMLVVREHRMFLRTSAAQFYACVCAERQIVLVTVFRRPGHKIYNITTTAVVLQVNEATHHDMT